MSEWPINWRSVVEEAVRRRKAEEMTQADLAALAGVSRPTVVAFEQGEINLRFERVIAILDALGLFVQPGRADSLQTFIFDARRRFEDITRDLDERSPSRQPSGHSEHAYAIDGNEAIASLAKLRDILGHAPKTSGWPPFWCPSRESLKPTFYDGILECWLGKPNADRVLSDAAHSDFWRFTRDGTGYLQRGYQEDGHDLEKGTFFDLTLPVWRTAEVLLHAAWVARQLRSGGSGRIRYIARYTGLAGRELLSWAKPTLRFTFEQRYRARSDSVELKSTASVQDIEENLESVVSAVLSPLYERFDGYAAPEAMISSQIEEFRANLQT